VALIAGVGVSLAETQATVGLLRGALFGNRARLTQRFTRLFHGRAYTVQEPLVAVHAGVAVEVAAARGQAAREHDGALAVDAQITGRAIVRAGAGRVGRAEQSRITRKLRAAVTLGFADVRSSELAAFDAVAFVGARFEREAHAARPKRGAGVVGLFFRGHLASRGAKALGRSAVAQHGVFGGDAGKAWRCRIDAVFGGDARATELARAGRTVVGLAAAVDGAGTSGQATGAAAPAATDDGTVAAAAVGAFIFSAAHRCETGHQDKTCQAPRLRCFHRTEASKKGPALEPPSRHVSFSVKGSERKDQTWRFARNFRE